MHIKKTPEQYNCIDRRCTTMSFKIKSDRKETENNTIRFPLPLLQKIETVIKRNDVTFSGFVIQACEYALENMEQSEEGK